MISINKFIGHVNSIARDQPTYRLGGRGADGTCDCVGLIIGAMYRAGASKYGLHSSNYFARKEQETIYDISDNDLFVGMIVYKRREAPINDRYMPGGSFDNGDYRDYYHVGVVTNVSPLEITHCTSSQNADGIVVDYKLGQWCCGGKLKNVDYNNNKEENVKYEAGQKGTVIAESGNTVRMRLAPSTKGKVANEIDVGEQVEVYDTDGEWTLISYYGKRGYMMSKFIRIHDDEESIEQPDESFEHSDNVGVFIPCASYEDALILSNALKKAVVKEG